MSEAGFTGFFVCTRIYRIAGAGNFRVATITVQTIAGASNNSKFKIQNSLIMDNTLIQKYIEGTATEQEVSAVRNYLIEDGDAERCYDIIFQMRKYAMEKLGIKSDFVENETDQ
ncbi:MAG: hypothetical protein LBK58_13285 [Prevotellaceae bacterium]|jgi:hypothetical protein|nr:hypothetical protein [Prevotellaceae bacterium]